MARQTADDRRTESRTRTARIGRRGFLASAGSGAVGLAGVAHGQGGRGAANGRDGDESDGGSDEHNSPAGEDADVAATDVTAIAHRAFAGVYPENTVGAAAAASRGGRSPLAPSRGADAIEIDVVPTADGDVVVFHDDRLASRDGGERGLTDAEGVVWETDTETVTSASVLGTSETVPLLREVLEAIPPSVGVNVELKNPGSFDVAFAEKLSEDDLTEQTEVWRPFVERVLAAVDEFEHEFLFSSFYEAALAATSEASDYPVAPILWDSIEDGIDIARRYDAAAVHPPYNMIQGTPFYADPYYTEGSDWADVDLLEVAHEEERDVNVYTVATWYQASQLAAAGVDGLIADYPDVLRFEARYD